MQNNMTLNEIAESYGTDKRISGHGYVNQYQTYLDNWRDFKFNLLEIGVYDGASLKTWKKYFPKADITGIDIDIRCKEYEEDRVNVVIGDQTDVNFLTDITNNKEYSIMIDDGGHTWKQQIVSFETLFPKLSPGGIYFVEDVHTSYVQKWKDYNISGVDYFKSLVDKVNLYGKSFIGYTEIHNQQLDYFERNIEYVHFYKSIIIIGKKQESL